MSAFTERALRRRQAGARQDDSDDIDLFAPEDDETDPESNPVGFEKTALATASGGHSNPEPGSGEPGTGELSVNLSDIGDRVVSVLRSAEESAQRILADVNEKALEIQRETDRRREEVDGKAQAADDEAAHIITAAREEAAAMIAAARKDAEQLRAGAVAEASRLHDAARRIRAHIVAASESIAESAEVLPALIAGIDTDEAGEGDGAKQGAPADAAEASAPPAA